MTFISIADAPSRSTYESVATRLGLAQNPPAGLVMHTAGELDSGQVRIVDIWESERAMRSFSRKRLWPALEAAGIVHTRVTGRREALESFEYVAPR
jgi:hypothetical protein